MFSTLPSANRLSECSSVWKRTDGTELASGTTDKGGRIANLLPDDAELKPGAYRLRFLDG